MTGEQFLFALDKATDEFDREQISSLSLVAFARKNINWQAAARQADNYVIAVRTHNEHQKTCCLNAFRLLVPAILEDK